MPDVSTDVTRINVTHRRPRPNVLQIRATLAWHVAVCLGCYCYNQRGIERDGEVLQMSALVHDATHEPDCLPVARFLLESHSPELDFEPTRLLVVEWGKAFCAAIQNCEHFVGCDVV